MTTGRFYRNRVQCTRCGSTVWRSNYASVMKTFVCGRCFRLEREARNNVV